MQYNIYLKPFVAVSRYVLAALFIFSGLAKAVNPFGLSVQLGEYFSAMHLPFFAPTAPIFAILLPALETLLGFMLLTNLCKRVSAWAVMLFMSFFTLLTLWIVIYSPVKDCGCFGDLLKISNMATFIKNIVFLALAIHLFVTTRRDNSPSKHPLLKWVIIVPLSLILPIYTSFTLPIIDATPFRIGVNIPNAMDIPDDAPRAIQQTKLIYRNLKSGENKEFEMTDTTWYDTATWEFVESRTTTLSEGFTPKIASLPILTSQGEDVHEAILDQPRILLIILPNIKDLPSTLPHAQGLRTVVLTASQIPQSANLEIYNSDYTLLRTMIQHPKGGGMLLENGTIVAKWAMPQLPKSL